MTSHARARARLCGLVFLFVIQAQASRPASVVASLNQSCGPNSRRTASIRIMAAPLPWFLIAGSDLKTGFAHMIFMRLPVTAVLTHAVMRQPADGAAPSPAALSHLTNRPAPGRPTRYNPGTRIPARPSRDPDRQGIGAAPGPPMSKNARTGSSGSAAIRPMRPSAFASTQHPGKIGPFERLRISPSQM